MKYQPTRDKNEYPYAKNYGHAANDEISRKEAATRIYQLERGLDDLHDELENMRLMVKLLNEIVLAQNKLLRSAGLIADNKN